MNAQNNNYKSFVVKLSLWAQGKGLPGASPAWLTKVANVIATSENPKLAEKFIRQYGIDHTQAERCSSTNTAEECALKYGSLSNFFTRRIKNIRIGSADIVSPATCKAMLFDTFEHSRIWVKGQKWSAARLLRQPLEFQDFALGIFRLRPKDYHRFHVPLDGVVTDVTKIKGGYLSVDPAVVTTRNVFTENTRVVVELNTAFGRCYFVAIGAAGVGSVRIFARPGETVRKGEELGLFDFGGSTVILMVPNPRPGFWRDDITRRSIVGKETYVDVGTSL